MTCDQQTLASAKGDYFWFVPKGARCKPKGARCKKELGANQKEITEDSNLVQLSSSFCFSKFFLFFSVQDYLYKEKKKLK